MDYLNPARARRDMIMLYLGYVLIAIAIALATVILVYIAYGFGIKKGVVIQNGLVFFSSQPNPAVIGLSGQPQTYATNTRLALPEGIYQATLSRAGYRDWQRTIQINGGSVEHFDYPLLVPKELQPKTIDSYSSAPPLMTQSPDHRWVLINQPDNINNFDLFDISAKQSVKTSFSLPDALLTRSTSDSWQLIGWADDNQHVLLKHIFSDSSEYILLNISSPADSLNLTKELNQNPTQLTLANLKFDHYYLYDGASKTLSSASLGSPNPTPVLSHVLAYQSYGSSSVLYVSDQNVPAGQVAARLFDGSKSYNLKNLSPGPNYVLNLTQYRGTLYVAVGSEGSNKVYIYADPIGQLSNQPHQDVVPSQVLRVAQPNYVAFSANAQFIVAENGSTFGVYDVFNQKGFSYQTTKALDSPQPHANWMDGDRLDFVSGGDLTIFDYDHTNQQTLMKASSQYLPAFTPDYKYVYTLTPSAAAGQYDLVDTSLLIPADQ